jgi:predicted alpha-1,6-mannanase (GH76 family)
VNSNILDPTSASPVWDSNFTKLAAASQLVLYTVAYKGDPTVKASWTGADSVAISVLSGGTELTKGTHQGAKWINVLYADMHVASIKLTDFQTIADNSTGGKGGVDGINQWQPMGH